MNSFWDIDASGVSSSETGTGLPTAAMHDVQTYLDAGWDFVDEILNGAHETWQMPQGGGYPVLAVLNGYAAPALRGRGTADDPYLVSTAIELGSVQRKSHACYKLTAPLDLSGSVWSDVVVPVFTGAFDGNGFSIQGLSVSGGNYVGLFGRTESGAQVYNLTLADVDVIGAGVNTGGLVGQNDGQVRNCSVWGTVSGRQNIGGLVGRNSASLVNCDSTCDVSGETTIGGLVGRNSASLVNCDSTCDVFGETTIGGLVGYNGGGDLIGCHSVGTVSGSEFVGGLAGHNVSGTVHTCSSIGPVEGNYRIGGLVGANDYASLRNCYSTGRTSGDASVGGLIGRSWVGETISCYSAGTVTGDGSVGGLVGSNVGGAIALSFWDIDASGRANMCGWQGSAGGCSDSCGRTTAEMQSASTFLEAGWDLVGEILNGTCDYWQISPGDYPRLCDPAMPEGLGTAQEPYLIRDARDLGTVWSDPLGHYRLQATVDLSGTTWSMPVIPWFGGTFDGNGYVISNLRIHWGGDLGLFGQSCAGAVISNLGVEAVDVDGSDDNVGGLLGRNEGDVTNCHSTGTVAGDRGVGGLVGDNRGSIARSYSTGTVTGRGSVGGLVGSNDGSIARSHSTGTVAGRHGGVGGLVGRSWEGDITGCYSAGTVTGNVDVGGLVGSNKYCTIASSFWDIDTSGRANMCGQQGLVGGCNDSCGRTTAEMQSASTFLEAGWDFFDETENGTEDIWWILEGQDYPRLRWEGPADYPDAEIALYRFWSPVSDTYFYTHDNSEKDEILGDSSNPLEYQGVACYVYARASWPGLAPVHRFFCEALGRYFYTINEPEKDKLIEDYSHVWAYDGIVFYVFAEGQRPVGASPVYRFWSGASSSHFYTIDEEEKNRFIAEYSDVWVYEGIAWYAYKP
jgi:hypothetical protein